MKNILLALAIFITSISLQAQSKVGTIDAEYILEQMPEIATVEEGVKTYNNKLQADVQASITIYEELLASYQTHTSKFTPVEKSAKESEIISNENDIKNCFLYISDAVDHSVTRDL